MSSGGRKVLVTGASGFLSAHVIDTLLKRGYHVRGTVRTQEKADQIIQRYPQYKDKLEFTIVKDITEPKAFDVALEGVDGVFHMASPFNYKVEKSVKEDLLDPAVNGTIGILRAAMKFPNIKRIVITSSFAAMVDRAKGPDYPHTEKDWNPVTQEQAEKGNAIVGYFASKKLAEAAAWDFFRKNKPSYELVAVCPPMVYGPFLHHIEKLEDLNESSKEFYENVVGRIPLDRPGTDVYVDVRDAAMGHVLAFEKKDANGERYLLANGNYNWHELVDFIHKEFPGQTKAHSSGGKYPPRIFMVDNTKSVKELGMKYHSKESTYRDTVTQLLNFNRKSAQ